MRLFFGVPNQGCKFGMIDEGVAVFLVFFEDEFVAAFFEGVGGVLSVPLQEGVEGAHFCAVDVV